MPGKSHSNPWLIGQDVPYNANSSMTQEYEQQKKQQQALLKLRSQPKAPPTSVFHAKAVQRNKTFFDWSIARRMFGGPRRVR